MGERDAGEADIEVDDDLDDSPDGGTPAGGAKGAEDDHGDDDRTSSDRSDRATRPTVNRWGATRDAIGETLKGIKGEESDHQPDDEDLHDDDDDVDDEDADDEDSERREDRSDRQDEDEDPERKGEGKGKKPGDTGDEEDEEGDESASSRYEVFDPASGDKFKIDLPKGAVIRLPADGKIVELKSIEDLVANAQKGLAFDRVTSRAGQENATLRTQIQQFEQAQEEDSDLLLKLVFGELDDEELEKLQKELEPYKDPKAREGLKALAELDTRKKGDAAAAARSQREAARTFWDTTATRIASDLPKFDYLDAEDAPEIQNLFYGEYQAEYNRLLPDYKKQAADQNLDEKEAEAAADRDARKVLTEKTLRKVMRNLNGKYQSRAGKGGDGKAEKKGIRETEQHNRHVDDKQRQRRDPKHRSLRGGGSAPRDRTNMNRRDKEPVGFDAKIQRGLRRLRNAGREAAGSGAED